MSTHASTIVEQPVGDFETPTPAQYEAAAALEQYLGDPADAANVFSFAQAVEADELELYPDAPSAALNALGFQNYYVPVEEGGRLRSYEELLALLRVLARRDLTIVVSHTKTYLGAAAVWTAGTPQQRQHLARLICDGHLVALAYNEKAHGSDFLATDLTATKVPGGYLLSGEKWLINNATRARALTLIARTSQEVGPRACSLFLIDKAALDPATFSHLPKIKTLGIRGADFSGIRFNDTFVPDEALLGTEGSALEHTLKAFQLTRCIIPGLSLGAADTALRLTMEFAVGRKLYGGSVWRIPQARRELVEAFVEVLVCDSMATGAVRALHATPEQMRLYAAAVKYYVPTSVEEVIRRAGVILGARHYLREGHCAGAFQKLVRDSSVLSIFHSGTFLNLTTVGMYLGELANRRATAVRQSTEQIAQRVAAIFTLSHPLPAFDASRLKVYTRGRDDVLYGLPSTLSRLRRLKDSLTTFTDVQGEVRVEVQVEVLDEIIRLTTELCQEVEAEDARQREMEAQLGNAYGTSPEMFEQAGRYCVLHAAASCVHLWAHSRAHMEEFYRGGEWVVLGLARQLKKLRGVSEAVAAEYYERVAEQLERLHAEQRSFALVPLHLAQADRREVEELLSAAV